MCDRAVTGIKPVCGKSIACGKVCGGDGQDKDEGLERRLTDCPGGGQLGDGDMCFFIHTFQHHQVMVNLRSESKHRVHGNLQCNMWNNTQILHPETHITAWAQSGSQGIKSPCSSAALTHTPTNTH